MEVNCVNSDESKAVADASIVEYAKQLNTKLLEAARILSGLVKGVLEETDSAVLGVPENAKWMTLQSEKPELVNSVYFSFDDGFYQPNLPHVQELKVSDQLPWSTIRTSQLLRWVDEDRADALLEHLEVRIESSAKKPEELQRCLKAWKSLNESIQLKRFSDISERILASGYVLRKIDWLKISNKFGGKFSDVECELKWRELKGRDLKVGNTWTLKEDQRVRDMVKELGARFSTWEHIGDELKRDPLACAKRFHQHLDENQNAIITSSISSVLKKIALSKRGEIINWRNVRDASPEHNLTDVKALFKRWMVKNSYFRKDGAKFSSEETLLMIAGIILFGKNFDAMSCLFPRRSAKQLRRHHNYVLSEVENDSRRTEYRQVMAIASNALQLTAEKIECGLAKEQKLTKRNIFVTLRRALGFPDSYGDWSKTALCDTKKPALVNDWDCFLFPSSDTVIMDKVADVRCPRDYLDVASYLIRLGRHRQKMFVRRPASVPGSSVNQYMNELMIAMQVLELPSIIGWEVTTSFPMRPRKDQELTESEAEKWLIPLGSSFFSKPRFSDNKFNVLEKFPGMWMLHPSGDFLYGRGDVFRAAFWKISECTLRSVFDGQNPSLDSVIDRKFVCPPTSSLMAAYQIMEEQGLFLPLARKSLKRIACGSSRESSVILAQWTESLPLEIVITEPKPAIKTYSRKRKFVEERPIVDIPTTIVPQSPQFVDVSRIKTYSRKKSCPENSPVVNIPSEPLAENVSRESSRSMSNIEAMVWLDNVVERLFSSASILSSVPAEL
ncbi:unnamed protein product [Notodromas monacha]|uniref:Uncharacterized protein n=1 Tax=Notodromas monacha TaxID=399045 RepID=A0A7R9GGA2_9CRUS|nr:unnamed protein product [Notodromas monacha]CAG0919751.1 unnamed protein product [Notodromas monacha]